MKSERGIIEEKEQQYGDSVILIYRGVKALNYV